MTSVYMDQATDDLQKFTITNQATLFIFIYLQLIIIINHRLCVMQKIVMNHR